MYSLSKRYIDPEAFNGTPRLRELRIEENGLRSLCNLSQAGLSNLQSLYVGQNRQAMSKTYIWGIKHKHILREFSVYSSSSNILPRLFLILKMFGDCFALFPGLLISQNLTACVGFLTWLSSALSTIQSHGSNCIGHRYVLLVLSVV